MQTWSDDQVEFEVEHTGVMPMVDEQGYMFLTSPKFKPVRKDRLFYDQFEYCIGFRLDEVSCLRVLDHAHIDDMIERRKQWREIAQQRWVTGRQKHGIIMSRRWKDITENTTLIYTSGRSVVDSHC
jgi:hypothetical protein